jgi:hypothetical protein
MVKITINNTVRKVLQARFQRNQNARDNIVLITNVVEGPGRMKNSCLLDSEECIS